MILHTFYSPSHSVLVDNYFIPSIRDKDINLVVDMVPQECSGVYMKDNWHSSMLTKLDLCKKLAEGREVFIHSDCDVQFFRPIKDSAEKALTDFDIVFQHDGQGHLCLGLFCAKPSKKLSELFSATQEIIRNHNIESQQAINLILRTKNFPYDFSSIRYGYLPNSWWTHGADLFKVWCGEELYPPEGIVAHHANWVEGVENKIRLLNHIMKKVYNGDYEWVKNKNTASSLDDAYGKSKDNFILLPRGQSGNSILKNCKITKQDMNECIKRGAT